MQPFPYRIIDLTHTLDANTPSWSGECGFQLIQKEKYVTEGSEVVFSVQGLTLQAGIGTHMDAPAHCIPGGMHIDDLALDNLVAPCVVIDVSSKADAQYCVSAADIEAFEAQHGEMAPGIFVIIHTGWSQYWDDAARYRNNHQFPSVSQDAAKMLLSRGVVGLGIDTLSPDTPDSGYPVHRLFLGAGKYLVENVAHADKLPPVGSYTLALPIKVRGAVEAPMRLVACISLK